MSNISQTYLINSSYLSTISMILLAHHAFGVGRHIWRHQCCGTRLAKTRPPHFISPIQGFLVGSLPTTRGLISKATDSTHSNASAAGRLRSFQSSVCIGECLASLLPCASLYVIKAGDHDFAETHASEIAPLIDEFLTMEGSCGTIQS